MALAEVEAPEASRERGHGQRGRRVAEEEAGGERPRGGEGQQEQPVGRIERCGGAVRGQREARAQVGIPDHAREVAGQHRLLHDRGDGQVDARDVLARDHAAFREEGMKNHEGQPRQAGQQPGARLQGSGILASRAKMRRAEGARPSRLFTPHRRPHLAPRPKPHDHGRGGLGILRLGDGLGDPCAGHGSRKPAPREHLPSAALHAGHGRAGAGHDHPGPALGPVHERRRPSLQPDPPPDLRPLGVRRVPARPGPGPAGRLCAVRGRRLRLLADPHGPDRASVDPRHAVASPARALHAPVRAQRPGPRRAPGRSFLRAAVRGLRLPRRARPGRPSGRGPGAFLEALEPVALGRDGHRPRGGASPPPLLDARAGARSRALRARQRRDRLLLGRGGVVPRH